MGKVADDVGVEEDVEVVEDMAVMVGTVRDVDVDGVEEDMAGINERI